MAVKRQTQTCYFFFFSSSVGSALTTGPCRAHGAELQPAVLNFSVESFLSCAVQLIGLDLLGLCTSSVQFMATKFRFYFISSGNTHAGAGGAASSNHCVLPAWKAPLLAECNSTAGWGFPHQHTWWNSHALVNQLIFFFPATRNRNILSYLKAGHRWCDFISCNS